MRFKGSWSKGNVQEEALFWGRKSISKKPLEPGNIRQRGASFRLLDDTPDESVIGSLSYLR